MPGTIPTAEFITSHAWFSTILHSIGDAVIATDAQGRVAFMNEVAERLTGWPSNEARGRPLCEVFVIVNETTRAPVEDPVAKVLREGNVVGLANHTVLIGRSGAEIAIDDSAAPIRGADGEITGVVLIFRDVTDKRREEQRQRFIGEAVAALSSSLDYEETLKRVALMAVPHFADWCAVDMLQEDGTVRRLAVAHVDPDKVRWAYELERRYPPPPDAPRGLPHVLRTGQSEWMREIPDELLVAAAVDEEHLRIARQLGLRSYVVAPMVARGRTLGAISFVTAESGRLYDERDVRAAEGLAERAAVALDNARLYREALAARAAAEEAAEVRERLVSIVSHDLRNPLSAVLMSVSQLQRRDLDPAEARTVERVRRSAMRMQEMVDRLLDFSRAQRGRALPVQLREARLDLICRAVIEELEAGHPHSQVALETEGALEGCWDPDRMGEVLSNLIGNAIQHGGGAPVRVSARGAGSDAVVAVHNQGAPIPDELLPHLFEPFRRGRTVGEGGGLGLGLYIAQQIVHAHHGEITAHSTRDEGTTFTVRVPLHPPSRATAPPLAPS